MPMQELGLPIGMTALKLVRNGVNYPLLIGTDTFTRTGEDGAGDILPLNRGTEFVGEVLDGQWVKGWNADMDADQAFVAKIASGALNLLGEADVEETFGYGWINSKHPVPMMKDTEVIVSLQVPVDITGASNTDLQYQFYLTKDKQATTPRSDPDYILVYIDVNENGLIMYLYKEVLGVATLLFSGSTYDDASVRATGDLEGTIWRIVFHDGVTGADSPSDVRHMHIYLKQSDTIANAESETEYELSTSPYDISDLTFNVSYPSYLIGSQNTTYFDDASPALSNYLRVNHEPFTIQYDIPDANWGLGDVELWDGDPDSGGIQVFDEDHVFSENVYIQNSVTRLLISELEWMGLKHYGYISGGWVLVNDYLYYRQATDANDLAYPEFKNVVSVSPEKVVINVRLHESADYDDDYYCDIQLTIERGTYHIDVLFQDSYPKQLLLAQLYGNPRHRFGYIGDNDIGDDDLGLDGNNTTFTDNFMIRFDNAGDLALGGFSVNLDPTTRFYTFDGGFLGYNDISVVGYGSMKLRYYTIPFSLVTNLFEQSEDGNYGAAGTVTDAAADPLLGANNAVQLNAIGDYQTPAGEFSAYEFEAGTDLPAGRYLAVIRARYVDVETMEMYVWADDDNAYRNEENAKVTKTLAVTFGYHSVVFDITDDDVTDTEAFAIVAEKTTDDATEIRTDYVLVVPICDGESWPQDLAHAAMRGSTKPKRLLIR